MADEVLSEVRGRILLITLNRPAARNAIDTALAQGLLAAVEQLDEDDGLTAGVLTGAGRGFCAGMDLKAFATDGPPRGFDTFLDRGSAKPLIAAIEGFALAGPTLDEKSSVASFPKPVSSLSPAMRSQTPRAASACLANKFNFTPSTRYAPPNFSDERKKMML